MKNGWNVYAYVCATCKHRAVIHGKASGEPERYKCRECGCMMSADQLMYELSRKEWNEWQTKYPESRSYLP